MLRTFIREEAGAVAMVFAFATPLLVGGTTLAVDAAALHTTRTALQAVADSTALAGAKELHLYNTNFDAAEQGMRERALALLEQGGLGDAGPSVDAVVDSEESKVTVTVSATPTTMVLGSLGYVDILSATAVAGAFGSTKLCVLALDESDGQAIHTQRIGSIDAPECAVQSNSPAADSIAVDLLSSIEAVAICSAGGVDGPGAAFEPEPTTDCPAIEDPLVDHQLSAVGPCNHHDMQIILPRTISPGHYCGGLCSGRPRWSPRVPANTSSAAARWFLARRPRSSVTA